MWLIASKQEVPGDLTELLGEPKCHPTVQTVCFGVRVFKAESIFSKIPERPFLELRTSVDMDIGNYGNE